MSGSRNLVSGITAAFAAVVLAACADLGSTGGNTLALGAAFQTVPAGFSANSNSFDASGDAGMPFFPGPMDPGIGFDQRGRGPERGGAHDERDHRDGFGPGGLRGLLMGGGLGPEFIGGIPFGKGRGRGPFSVFNLPASCTFDAAAGRVTCPEFEQRGLTVNASYAFLDAAGAAQPAFDTASTNTVNVAIDVSGTKMRRDSTITELSHSSDRTIAGLAPGATERTVNGTAEAHESTTGTREGVAFTLVRDAGDTTNNVVIPISEGRPTVPSSGTVIRAMSVTITPEGGAATTRSRREEITFDGTNVVQVKITQDGDTKNCTITLPGKKLVCE